jgi:2-iminobutanoate/2-iminopropanoate deaminase
MTKGRPGYRAIETDGSPKPGGHYAQGVVAGDLIYVSGQLPVAPNGAHNVGASFADQARQALANLLAVVEAGGGRRESVIRVTAYIVDTANWPAFNAVYADIFGDARPTRTVVPAPALHYGYLVEVDAVALVD